MGHGTGVSTSSQIYRVHKLFTYRSTGSVGMAYGKGQKTVAGAPLLKYTGPPLQLLDSSVYGELVL